MRRLVKLWWRLLLIVPLSQGLLGSSAGCLANVLRGAADELSAPDEDQSAWDMIVDDIEGWF